MTILILILSFLGTISCDSKCGSKEDLIGTWKTEKVRVLDSQDNSVPIDENSIELQNFKEILSEINYTFLDQSNIKVSLTGADKVLDATYNYNPEDQTWQVFEIQSTLAKLIFIDCDRFKSIEKIKGTSLKLEVEMVRKK